ncbi:MAG: histidine kinase dimerization/phospho-acceptor domain-containing protein, partial [Spirochaetota bacterium]
MRHRRHRVSTVVLIIVLVAIPPAGVLQYHLLDQAMDAEAASLMRVANATTRQIRGDLAYEAMSLVSVLASWDASEDDTARLIELYEAWASGARFPELVESIVIATGEGGQTTYRAHRPDSDSFRVVDPADLPWLAQLAAGPDLRVPGDPRVTADPFVLGVPVFRFVRTDDRTAVEAPAAQPSRMYVRIDRSVLVTGVIPRLVADHVGDGPDAFHVALVDTASSAVLFSTTDVTFADLSLDRTPRAGAIAPDEVAPLLRPGSASSILARLRSSGGANPVAQQWVALLEWARIDDPSRPHEAARPEGDIALAVWHPAGGVRRAAQIDRNRNLALSYAFLGGVAAMAVMFHVLYLRTVRRRVREQEFVASVTHELRTPVAAMHAAAENLAEGVVTRPERVREYGRSLLDESRRLRTLVDQTLRLSGLQTDLAMRFEPVDVRAVVLEELAAESRLAPGDVHLRIDDAAGPVL